MGVDLERKEKAGWGSGGQRCCQAGQRSCSETQRAQHLQERGKNIFRPSQSNRATHGAELEKS